MSVCACHICDLSLKADAGIHTIPWSICYLCVTWLQKTNAMLFQNYITKPREIGQKIIIASTSISVYCKLSMSWKKCCNKLLYNVSSRV